MEVFKSEDYHEDFGCCIFINFSRNDRGEIIGEPPELEFSCGYLTDGFDDKKWTHFVKGDFNFLSTGADPVNFPAWPS